MPYVEGDHYFISDRSGLRFRVSEMRKEWNGSVVHVSEWDPRHPQDFVRGLADKQSVPNARPQPIDIYVGPLTTAIAAAAAAGAMTVTVENGARFASGDRVAVFLDNGEIFRVILSGVAGNVLSLVDPLPWATSPGLKVIDFTANAPSDVRPA